MKTTSYYLLILYTFAVCKPIVPVVTDTFSHIFWKANHIATVHALHGNRHTAEELQAEANENSKKKTDKAVLFETQSAHTTPNFFRLYFVSETTSIKYLIQPHSLLDRWMDNIYIPPKA